MRFEQNKFKIFFSDDSDTARMIYKLIKKAKKLSIIFPYENVSVEKFVKYMTINSHLYICYYDDQIAGIAWINRWESVTARINFTPLSINLRIVIPAIREAAKRLIYSEDINGYAYECLVGLIHIKNKPAQRIAKAIGMQEQGIIPNYYRPTHSEKAAVKMFTLTRENISYE